MSAAWARLPPVSVTNRLRGRLSPWTVIVATALVAGIAVRVWIFFSPLATLEADEAIVGLMARRALDGDFYVLYWLSLYGGTQEAYLTAAVFALTGSSVLVLKLVPLTLFAGCGVLLWRVGLRTVGEPAARLGAGLFWIFPAYLVWWTTKARAYYAMGLLCELVVLLLVLRLRERDSRRDAALLGLALGCGVWATLQFLLGALPALGWLAWRRPRAFRLAWIAVPAFAVGGAPWLVWNASHDWKAVFPKAVAGADTSYGERLGSLFSTTLPTWLGLRVPFTLDWLVGPALGWALLGATLAGFTLLVLRWPKNVEPLLVIAVLFPFLYAASSFTYFVGEPRYLVYLAPVTALLFGRALSRPRIAVIGLIVLLALTVAGLVRLERDGTFRPPAPDVRIPVDIGPLVSTLERERAHRVLANYWIAYRLSFETGERILASSTGFVRDLQADRIVRSSPNPAYVFLAGSRTESAARSRLEARGYRRLLAGGFVAYVRR